MSSFMKYENSENRFSEFSLTWKSSFSYQWRLQNVNIKVKRKHKVVICTLYWKNWKIDSSSFLRIMNENDFNFDAITISSVLSSEEVWKIVSVFPFFLKKRSSDVCFCQGIWSVLDSTRLGHTDKIRYS